MKAVERDQAVEEDSEHRLYEAVMTLKSVSEAHNLFRDLCTPAELQAMADRWRVVEMLREDRPYREIHDRTGVSVTTIGRVARYLDYGNGGYRLAVERLDEKKRKRGQKAK